MSYQDQWALGADSEFNSRMWAAVASEAVTKPAGDPLAAVSLADPYRGAQALMPYVATAPTFGDKYAAGGQESITDAELLSAIQAAWPQVQVPV